MKINRSAALIRPILLALGVALVWQGGQGLFKLLQIDGDTIARLLAGLLGLSIVAAGVSLIAEFFLSLYRVRHPSRTSPSLRATQRAARGLPAIYKIGLVFALCASIFAIRDLMIEILFRGYDLRLWVDTMKVAVGIDHQSQHQLLSIAGQAIHRHKDSAHVVWALVLLIPASMFLLDIVAAFIWPLPWIVPAGDVGAAAEPSAEIAHSATS